MNQKPSHRAFALALPFASLLLAVGAVGSLSAAAKPPAKAVPASVEALLYTTMPCTAAHRPEMAMDGDQASYFQTAYGMDDGDDFLVLLGRPVPIQSLHVTTGDADGQDLLTTALWRPPGRRPFPQSRSLRQSRNRQFTAPF